MALIGDDCHYYYTSQCRKGERCQYRHCDLSLGSDVVCPAWLADGCYMPDCPFRHAHLQNHPLYWNEHGAYPSNQPTTLSTGIQPLRSSLVSVPIIPDRPPYDAAYVPPVVPNYASYRPPDGGLYMESPYYDDQNMEPARPPGTAPVIITQRHDDFYPPQVQPMVVRIGSICDSSDTDASDDLGSSNLTALRRIETTDLLDQSPDTVTCDRKVVSKASEVARHKQEPTTQQEAHSEDGHSGQDDGHSGQEGGHSGQESVQSGQEVEEEEDGATRDEEDGLSEVSAATAEPDQEEEEGVTEEQEPELDLFDEDDTDILGVVERTPVSAKSRPRDKPDAGSKGSRKDSRRSRKRRQRRPSGSRSPLKKRRDVTTADNSPISGNNGMPQTTTVNQTTVKSPDQNAEKKKKDFEILSLEELMRQKALNSMIERRKQKEVDKSKGDGDQAAPLEHRPTSAPFAHLDDRPSHSDNDVRRRSRDRERPLPRRRSPPRYLDSRWRRDDARDRRRYDAGDGHRPVLDLDLIQAQADLVQKMTRLANGRVSRSERDLKRQQKLLKRQLKDLSRAIEARGRSSDSGSSLCSTCSLSSSSDDDRRQSKRRQRKAHKSRPDGQRRRAASSDITVADLRKKSVKKKKLKSKSRRNDLQIERDNTTERDNETEIDNKIESDVLICANVLSDGELESNDDNDQTATQTNFSKSSESESETEDNPSSPPFVLPRVKVTMKLEGSDKTLNISGSELLTQADTISDVTKGEKTMTVQPFPARKIQLKQTLNAQESGTKALPDARKVIGILAGKPSKGDDEAARVMLEKIRQSAAREAGGKMQVSSVVSAVDANTRLPTSSTNDVTSQPLSKQERLVQLAPVNKGRASIDPLPHTDLAAETDAAKQRRVIRRQPVQVYVPPAAKRRVDVAIPSIVKPPQVVDEIKPVRQSTPDPIPATQSSPNRRASVADVRTANAAATMTATSGTKFELGVKTFAEIMREKKERKDREIAERKRQAADGPSTGDVSRPKLVRPSIADRLTLPETKAKVAAPIATVAPSTAGSRTIQHYDDDWLTDHHGQHSTYQQNTESTPETDLLRVSGNQKSSSLTAQLSKHHAHVRKFDVDNELKTTRTISAQESPLVQNNKTVSSKDKLASVSSKDKLASVSSKDKLASVSSKDKLASVSFKDKLAPVATDKRGVRDLSDTERDLDEFLLASDDENSGTSEVNNCRRKSSDNSGQVSDTDPRSDLEELDLLLEDIPNSRPSGAHAQKVDDDDLLMELEEMLA